MMKILATILALGLVNTAQAQTSADTVLDCMRANLPPSLRIQDIELTTTDRSGASRVLKGRVYGQQEKSASGNQVRAMLRVTAPDNLAGASFLIREARQYADEGLYVWLPSVRRVRRVSGEFADGALLGTDFSYNDFKQLQNAFGGFSAAQLDPETVAQRPAWVLSFKPVPDAKSAYTEVRTWVDQKTCVPLKTDFYEAGKLRKQLSVTVEAIKRIDNYWYPAIVEMNDLDSGSRSTLRVLGVQPDDKLASRHFNPKLFYMPG
jgi:hypothetical protein